MLRAVLHQPGGDGEAVEQVTDISEILSDR